MILKEKKFSFGVPHQNGAGGRLVVLPCKAHASCPGKRENPAFDGTMPVMDFPGTGDGSRPGPGYFE
jgi:hypothetical protein